MNLWTHEVYIYVTPFVFDSIFLVGPDGKEKNERQWDIRDGKHTKVARNRKGG